jgi:hypothetical protein
MPKKSHDVPDPRFNLADPRFISENPLKKSSSETQQKQSTPFEIDPRFSRDFDAAPLQTQSQQQQQQRKRKRKQTSDNDEVVIKSEANDDYDKNLVQDATEAAISSTTSLSTSSALLLKNKKKANESIHERLDRLSRMSRGEIEIDEGGNTSSSSEEDGDEDDEEEEEKDNNKDEQEMLAREVDGPVIVQDPDAPDLEDAEHTTLDGQETNRLALVNCDWSELRAVDIFATLQSFVPKGRALFKVTVHLSDYGMKRLAEESRSGPSTVFASSSSSTSVDSTKPETVSSDTSKKKRSKVVEIGQPKGGRKKRGEEEEEGEDFDPERLRQYELNRMKYYFAIATFDSPIAASAVYNACDGMEFEASSNVFDLRFVPKDQTFDRHPQRDEATSIPLDYAPPIFATSALQSSKVELTWDGEDSARSRALDWDRVKDPESSVSATGKSRSKKKARGRELPSRTSDLNDISAYLASSESDDEDEENEMATNKNDSDKIIAKKSKKSEIERKRLRALLLGESSKPGKVIEQEDEDEEEEEEGREMTITYDPQRVKSASDILAIKAEREAREGESAWETYLRKRKEKRKAKKEAYKASTREEEEEEERSENRNSLSSAALKDDAFFASSDIGKSDKKEGKSLKKKKSKLTPLEGEEEEEEETETKKIKQHVDEDKVRAQLELQSLGLDDSGDEDGQNGGNFSLRKLMKAQKHLSGKGSKKDIAAAIEKKSKGDVEDFHVNVSDPRFAAAFSRNHPEFSIDPTSASFKDTVGMRKILATKLEDATLSNTDGDKKKKRVMVVTNAAATTTTATSSSSTSTNETSAIELGKRVAAKFSRVS